MCVRACVCVLSGWCPGDLMANTVCFHGPSFQPTAHRNAEHTDTHTHTQTHTVISLTSTHMVFRLTHKTPQQPIKKAYQWSRFCMTSHIHCWPCGNGSQLLFGRVCSLFFSFSSSLSSLTVSRFVFLLSLSDIVFILTQPNKHKLFSGTASLPVNCHILAPALQCVERESVCVCVCVCRADSGQMVQDSWSRVTSVCDPSLYGGERKKDNIDGEKLFEEEYFS